jgi:hypothetical protein
LPTTDEPAIEHNCSRSKAASTPVRLGTNGRHQGFDYTTTVQRCHTDTVVVMKGTCGPCVFFNSRPQRGIGVLPVYGSCAVGPSCFKAPESRVDNNIVKRQAEWSGTTDQTPEGMAVCHHISFGQASEGKSDGHQQNHFRKNISGEWDIISSKTLI